MRQITEVLRLSAQGLSYRQIAQSVGISEFAAARCHQPLSTSYAFAPTHLLFSVTGHGHMSAPGFDNAEWTPPDSDETVASSGQQDRGSDLARPR